MIDGQLLILQQLAEFSTLNSFISRGHDSVICTCVQVPEFWLSKTLELILEDLLAVYKLQYIKYNCLWQILCCHMSRMNCSGQVR